MHIFIGAKIKTPSYPNSKHIYIYIYICVCVCVCVFVCVCVCECVCERTRTREYVRVSWDLLNIWGLRIGDFLVCLFGGQVEGTSNFYGLLNAVIEFIHEYFLVIITISFLYTLIRFQAFQFNKNDFQTDPDLNHDWDPDSYYHAGSLSSRQ